MLARSARPVTDCKAKDMLTETMFTLGRRYALAGRDEQERIMRDALSRINHWIKREGDDMLVLFSCFVEGARSAERDDYNWLKSNQSVA